MHRAFLFPAMLIVGRVTNEYVGRSYEPTEYVDTFFDEQDVPHEYEVMGTDHAQAPLH